MRSRDVSRSAMSDSLAVVAANDGRAGRRTTPAAAAADAERRRARRDDGGRSSSSTGAHAMTRSEGSSIDDDDDDDDAPARDRWAIIRRPEGGADENADAGRGDEATASTVATAAKARMASRKGIMVSEIRLRTLSTLFAVCR